MTAVEAGAGWLLLGLLLPSGWRRERWLVSLGENG